MLNRKFINKLLTITILSICSSVVNASDNSLPIVKLRDDFVISKVNDFSIVDSNSNNSTIDSNKNSKDNSPEIKKLDNTNEINNNQIEEIILYGNIKNNSKNDSKNIINENITKEVKYDPDKMWFDYQKLFNKTRNVILGRDDTTKVECNINKNEFVKEVLSCEDSDFIIKQATDGETWAQDEIMDCIENYVESGSLKKESVLGNKLYNEINYNYRYLLGIVASLERIGNEVAKKRYLALVKYIPVDFYFDDISDISFFNIMHPILQDN